MTKDQDNLIDSSSGYRFTALWFEDVALENWRQAVPQLQPSTVVEIGCYEGRASSWLIETVPTLTDIFCIDTWKGGIEHQEGGNAEFDMSLVYNRFCHNVSFAQQLRKQNGHQDCRVHTLRGPSDLSLISILLNGIKADMVYIDGSHQAADVLSDAVLSWKILKSRGLMVFDDYIWREELEDGKTDLFRCPKLAVDAFTQIYWKDFDYVSAPLYQVYIQRK